MYLIAILFLYPIWRTARSKGYDAKPFVAVTAGVAFAGVAADVVLKTVLVDSPWSNVVLAAELGVPVGMLILVTLLKTRAGAPGKQWLTITFPCPYCHQSISFKRELEGLTRLCPECGEIVTVPEEEDQEAGSEST